MFTLQRREFTAERTLTAQKLRTWPGRTRAKTARTRSESMDMAYIRAWHHICLDGQQASAGKIQSYPKRPGYTTGLKANRGDWLGLGQRGRDWMAPPGWLRLNNEQ